VEVEVHRRSTPETVVVDVRTVVEADKLQVAEGTDTMTVSLEEAGIQGSVDRDSEIVGIDTGYVEAELVEAHTSFVVIGYIRPARVVAVVAKRRS
jgi:hypothetical protein